jgi:fibronectin-binding autotransporter adhesin
VDSTYIGTISGPNNVVKTGAGTLTLDGSTNSFTTTINGDGSITTNYFATNGLAYIGTTTVSNGVMAVVAPSNLNGTNFTAISLAGIGAVLDLSSAGYTPDGTNYITNSVLTMVSPQRLNGFGTIRASAVQLGAGTTLNPGNPSGNITNGTSTGILTVTNSLEIGGEVNMRIDRTNAVTADELAAVNFTIDGTATLLVTNIGPGLFNGDTFTLFSKPVSGFASVTLPPTDPTGTNIYVWNNNLAVNGTISLASGGQNPINPNPTNIVVGVTNGNLYMSWPADHTGWFLQAQTNTLSVGLKTNWVNVTGSDQTNLIVMPINPTNGAVFYRMIH